ncbi:MAG: hypothetical protein ACTSPO_14335 [Candidatus Heimdallarchaeaceae archaeon]
MRYGFKIREEGQPILFTSNKEVLYPRIRSLEEKQKKVEGDFQRYNDIMKKLLDLLEELEKLLSNERIKYKYSFVNGEDIEKEGYFIFKALKMIWRYCEPLDGESIGRLHQELIEIEKWL